MSDHQPPKKYATVNGQWPEGTREGRDLKPTAHEAIAAARRLYRFAFGRTFKGKVKLTSGWRYTHTRSGVLYVNPDQHGGGWHELVHSLSHFACNRLHPNASGHGHQHAFIEKEMIAHVVKSGWLDGKLKRAERPAVDRAALRVQRRLAAIKRWQGKMRRAQTALRKLSAAQRRHERQMCQG